MICWEQCWFVQSNSSMGTLMDEWIAGDTLIIIIVKKYKMTRHIAFKLATNNMINTGKVSRMQNIIFSQCHALSQHRCPHLSLINHPLKVYQTAMSVQYPWRNRVICELAVVLHTDDDITHGDADKTQLYILTHESHQSVRYI